MYHIQVPAIKYLERKIEDHQMVKSESDCLSLGGQCKTINDFASVCLHILNPSDGKRRISELLTYHAKQECMSSKTNHGDWEGAGGNRRLQAGAAGKIENDRITAPPLLHAFDTGQKKEGKATTHIRENRECMGDIIHHKESKISPNFNTWQSRKNRELNSRDYCFQISRQPTT